MVSVPVAGGLVKLMVPVIAYVFVAGSQAVGAGVTSTSQKTLQSVDPDVGPVLLC